MVKKGRPSSKPPPNSARRYRWRRRKSGVWVPVSSNMVYPTPLSLDERGAPVGETRAFLPLGTSVSRKRVRSFQELVDRWMEADQRGDPVRTQYWKGKIDSARNAVIESAASLSGRSSFFLKETDDRVKKIREILIQNRIPVEWPILETEGPLSNQKIGESGKVGLGLFERRGFNRIIEFDRKGKILRLRTRDPGRITDQMMEIVAKIHALGIVHGHLHNGNWLVNRKGDVKMIDLSEAKSFAAPPRTKSEFLDRFAADIIETAFVAADIQLGATGKTFRNVPRLGKILIMQNIAFLLRSHKRMMRCFGASPKDIAKFIPRKYSL